MKQLITVGDDFGYSRSITEAIIQAHQQGILTSASLMPCGDDFEHAVELARQTPTLSVGAHLCLLQARAVLPPDEIPLLADAHGDFHNNPWVAGLKFFLVPGIRHQIERELRAQMEKFLATGLRPSHVNTHMYLHAHPVVFPIVAALARECGVTHLRVPREDFRSLLLLNPRHFPSGFLRAIFFRLLSLGLERKIQCAGFSTTDSLCGLLQSGQMNETRLAAVLRHLEEGITEIYFHPGRDDDPVLVRWQPDYRHADETRALVSPEIRELIRKLGIRLTDFESAMDWKSAAVSSEPPLPANLAKTLDDVAS